MLKKIQIIFQMIFVVFNYPIFALLVWNQNDTRTTEYANAIRVYNFFTNPANAMNNITFLFGYVRIDEMYFPANFHRFI